MCFNFLVYVCTHLLPLVCCDAWSFYNRVSLTLCGRRLGSRARAVWDRGFVWGEGHDGNAWMTRYMWRLTCDVWCVTCDVWRVTCDVWRVLCDVQLLQVVLNCLFSLGRNAKQQVKATLLLFTFMSILLHFYMSILLHFTGSEGAAAPGARCRRCSWKAGFMKVIKNILYQNTLL